MARSNEAKKTSALPLETSAEQHNQPSHPTMKRTYLTAAALLSALIALIISLYTILQSNQLKQLLVDKNSQLMQQLTTLQQQQNATKEIRSNIKVAMEEQQQEVAAKIATLTQQVHTALEQSAAQNQNWLLLKARYYLELAQIDAHWSSSFSTAVALLQQADRLLRHANETEVLAIRQALAKDVAQLQTATSLDVAGLLSQLDAAQSSLEQLSIPASLDATARVKTPPTAEPTTSVWRIRLQDSLDLLNKLVVIRRSDMPINPLPSPAMEAIFKEQIRLNLQEAQWAVLNNNTQVYSLALNHAATTLKKNFNEQAPQTAVVLKQIANLQQTPLKAPKPDIGQALELLNKLINKQTPPESQTPPGGKP